MFEALGIGENFRRRVKHLVRSLGVDFDAKRRGIKGPVPDNDSAPDYLASTETNLEFNRWLWSDLEKWQSEHQYGYRWGRGVQQANSGMTRVAEKWLLPYLPARRNLKIMEIAPGAGRFTAELIRLSAEISLNRSK